MIDLDKLSDEEAVAMAMLLGATFIHGPSTRGGHVEKWDGHPFKPWSVFSPEEGTGTWTSVHANTQAEGARNFLARWAQRAREDA